ncbi:hypothetical protein [Rathayibacter sp. VKM Ac-2754]|uniref:hypothetical protein n=1 Tax=Rathayibacter sp. VKM Ac-2754 TaxID=2609251 RepID=UPI00135AF2CB|nr:hypothetical protein [Rathayibacter sp. VKM Ac-2754]MWV57433.1 hypothetical protein [Rathayibacter sp. VKM Ac-2754]
MNTLSLPFSPTQVLFGHWERALEGSVEPEWKPDPVSTPMRLLSPVEFASLRVQLRRNAEDLRPDTHGPVTDAALRIALWEVMGKRFSGYRLAQELQHFHFPHVPESREPWRGWDMLAAIDATADLHGVELVLNAEPAEPAWTRFREMRLSERLAEVTERRDLEVAGGSR